MDDFSSGAYAPLHHKHKGLDSDKLDYNDLNNAPALPLNVPNGGTGQSTLTTHGTLIGNGVGGINTAGPGSTGQVLTSNGGASDPTYQTPTAYSTLVLTGSNVVVSNTISQTHLFSYSVGANKLGTTKAMRVKLWVSNVKNATNNLTLFANYGSQGTSMLFGSQNLNRPGIIEASLIADGATNAQRIGLSFIAVAIGITQGANLNFGVVTNTLTVDSTSPQNFTVDAKFDSASVNDTITIDHYVVEFLT